MGLALWLALKIYKGITTGCWTKWWVHMEVGTNPRELRDRLWDLEFLSDKNEQRNTAVNGTIATELDDVSDTPRGA